MNIHHFDAIYQESWGFFVGELLVAGTVPGDSLDGGYVKVSCRLAIRTIRRPSDISGTSACRVFRVFGVKKLRYAWSSYYTQILSLQLLLLLRLCQQRCLHSDLLPLWVADPFKVKKVLVSRFGKNLVLSCSM